jgi:arsenite methyltransferase
MGGTSVMGIAPEQAVSLARDTPQLATFYDKGGFRQFNRGKHLIAALGIVIGEHVLDIGAGTGRLAAHVADIVGPSGSVAAIDPLPLRVEIARSRATANFTARVGRAEDLFEFADASFDVVYMNSVFKWVADKPRALREIFRVLKTGGRFGLTCPNPAHPNEHRNFISRALLVAGVEHDYSKNHPEGPFDHELEALLNRAGFGSFSTQLLRSTNFYEDVDDLLAFLTSASFGNFLGSLSEGHRTRVRDVLGRLLESNQTADGIRLVQHMTIATARKP